MFKRVFLVLTLLFAQGVAAQEVIPGNLTLGSTTTVAEQPVVAVTSATGSIQTIELFGSSTETVLPPAEVGTSSVSSASSSLIVSNIGAVGTSSTSTVSTTSETQDVASTNPSTDDERKLFELVYAGFEEFVRITLGWE